MNATPPVFTAPRNPEIVIESGPPSYDQVVPSGAGLIRLVTNQLSQIKLDQGDKEENLSAKKLMDHLISKYPGASTFEEPICITQAEGVSHEDFFKRFILQVTLRSPVLEFQEVNSRDELEQSKHALTYFYDVDNCVDLKICKIPGVIESVKNLVGKYEYSWISEIKDEIMNGQCSWGKYSGLMKNDIFVSAAGVDLRDESHERVIKHLRRANASTSYSPLFFFRNDTSLQKSKLIICTSTDPNPNRGMGLTISSDY